MAAYQDTMPGKMEAKRDKEGADVALQGKVLQTEAVLVKAWSGDRLEDGEPLV